ncbi:MAG TPA: Hsp70 family protein, partial [Synergistaceae bacterium]|nr:Hsp70 family protein [Synergistaceae bacterium]
MIVGIDFGTTNSSVAYLTPRGPELVVNERGERMTPSVVCFRSPHEALVGELA